MDVQFPVDGSWSGAGEEQGESHQASCDTLARDGKENHRGGRAGSCNVRKSRVLLRNHKGVSEETTTGVKEMSAKGELFFPVINVTDCVTNEQYHFYADNAPSHVSASTREFIRFSWASVQAALQGTPGRHCHFDPADQPFFVPLFRCDGTLLTSVVFSRFHPHVKSRLACRIPTVY